MGLPALLLVPLLAATPPLSATACPAAVVAMIDGLYRWHVAEQRESGPMVLISQRERFAPELYSQLVRALAMTPSEAGFVDFDVFSGTQVSTFGASVQGCRSSADGLEARVAVRAGLRGRPAETPMLLRYELKPGAAGSWRIADILYPEEPPLRLSTFLQGLLKPAGRSGATPR